MAGSLNPHKVIARIIVPSQISPPRGKIYFPNNAKMLVRGFREVFNAFLLVKASIYDMCQIIYGRCNFVVYYILDVFFVNGKFLFQDLLTGALRVSINSTCRFDCGSKELRVGFTKSTGSTGVVGQGRQRALAGSAWAVVASALCFRSLNIASFLDSKKSLISFCDQLDSLLFYGIFGHDVQIMNRIEREI